MGEGEELLTTPTLLPHKKERSAWLDLHVFGFFCFFFKILFIYRERGREGEIEGEKHRCVRDTLISCLS